jgi:hypothetical protein
MIRTRNLLTNRCIVNKAMAQKNVSFVATKTEKRPATVRFKTKSGETVSFKALKTVEVKEVLHFRTKKK